MTINETELKKKLNPKHVKTRKQGSTTLSYIEAWRVIEEANNIFGFDAWSRETVYNREVCRYEYTIGKGGQYEAAGWKVGYEAKVLVIVDGVSREGTGHGSGIAKDLFDAIESAGKEAESDAMKRAFMTFGYKFGLALYDKTQANVGIDAPTPEEKTKLAEAWTNGYLKKLELIKDDRALMNLQTDDATMLKRIEDGYPSLYKVITAVTKPIPSPSNLT